MKAWGSEWFVTDTEVLSVRTAHLHVQVLANLINHIDPWSFMINMLASCLPVITQEW